MNSKRFFKFLGTVFLSISMFSCTSNEIGESKDVAQDKIYQYYSINYTQGNPSAEAFSQFRFAGNKGTTLVLSNPSKIEFDGNIIKVDSSNYSGAYYVINNSVGSFYGKHHFVFTDINNKKFDNDFSFDAFKLTGVPASASKDQPLSILFETTPLKADDYITLSSENTDSSFSINHSSSDANNTIVVPAKELMRQKGKNLTISATLYRKAPLQQNTTEGGELNITYALKPVTIELK